MVSDNLSKFVYFVLCISLGNGFTFFGTNNGLKYWSKQIKNFTHSALSSVEEKLIEQPLDHFDVTEKRTWKMRYFQNFEFWEPNAPIHIYIGGEGESAGDSLLDGLMYDVANETNGTMFESEHRYYGQSIPLNTSVTENLKFLSSRQALADLASLIQSIKSKPNFEKSKVVVWGGSYAGNLAAWMRLLYPDLVDAAVSSSGPVLAKKDFYEYYETVAQDFKQHGTPGCYKNIVSRFNKYASLFNTPDGIKQLKREENICKYTDMTIPENKQLFFFVKTTDFAVEAQMGDISAIQQFCGRMKNHPFVPQEKVLSVDEFKFLRAKKGCLDYNFNKWVKELELSPWIYQTCTEFGYFQSTSFDDNNPFTRNLPADYYYKMCTGMFGRDFNETRIDEGVKTTNEMYQGLHPNVTHVVFVNGVMDPWHKLGVLKNLTADAPAIVIPNTSHCTALTPEFLNDPKELKEARCKIKYLIKNWLGVKNHGLNEVYQP